MVVYTYMVSIVIFYSLEDIHNKFAMGQTFFKPTTQQVVFET